MSRVKKNGDYVKLLVDEGARVPSDSDASFELQLPDWADHRRIKRAQLFFILNVNAMTRAVYLGLLMIIPEDSIYKILEFTKQSATPQLAYKRYKLTALHGTLWGKYDLKPGTEAWQSLKYVRKIHYTVSRRAEKNEVGIVSQKDMAITQFTFVGMQLLASEKLGIKASRQQLDDFAHYWRVLGYLLGIEDRFNACGENLDETLGRLEAMREDLLLPNFANLNPKIERYLRIAVEGMKGFEPWINDDVQLLTVKRLLGVPNSETQDDYNKLGLYAKFLSTAELIVFEYLSMNLLFRWTFNIFRIAFSVFEHYPIFAIIKFGKKFAYVKIPKAKFS